MDAVIVHYTALVMSFYYTTLGLWQYYVDDLMAGLLALVLKSYFGVVMDEWTSVLIMRTVVFFVIGLAVFDHIKSRKQPEKV